jgi:TonB family protein
MLAVNKLHGKPLACGLRFNEPWPRVTGLVCPMRTTTSHSRWLLPFLLLSCLCAGKSILRKAATPTLGLRERELWIAPQRDAEFAALPQTVDHTNCEATQLPQALATPDPVLDRPEGNAKIEVSFIIGTDGLVHSPLILESAGTFEDRAVLTAVRSWRYRPALCNGVPTEAEAKVEFSNR